MRRAWLALVAVACCCTEGGAGSDAGPTAIVGDDAGRSGCSIALCFPYGCDERWRACRSRCSEDAHCADGFTCQAGLCTGGECSDLDAGQACGPYACERGLCATTCSQSGCADGFYCEGDTGRCLARCTAKDDPLCRGFLCDVSVGECEPICFPGRIECASGYACDPDGKCSM